MNRYLGALFLGVCLSSTALVGCGDDSTEDDGEDGGGEQKAQVNESSAAVVGSQSAAAARALTQGDGQSAAGSLFAAAQVASSIAVPQAAGQQQQSLAGDLGIAVAADCETECVAEGDSGSCDFTNCDTGTFSLAGHMEWTATHFACDMTYGISASSQGQNIDLDYHLVADVDYTATSIDGTLAMDGSATAGGQTSSFDVDVTYNALQFPAEGGCPTSGSISVTAVIDAGAAHYEASGDVTFPVAGCTG